MAEKRVSVRLVAEGGRQVRAELEGIGEAGSRGFGRLSSEMELANARLGNFARKAGIALAAVTAAAAAAGVAMVRSGLDAIGAQADMAASLRTTVESLQVLTWAGELAGVSMGEIEQATKKLTTRLSEAAAGSGSAVGALQRLNLTAAELQALPLDQRIVAIQDALGRFVPGKLDFRDLVTSMIADLAKLAARRFILGPIANALSGALGGAGGIFANILHAGGMVGSPGPGRMVPAMAFAGAPRMHAGGWAGIKPDEVPAILQRGERVLSRREVAGYGQTNAPAVNVTIMARDAESFRQSRTQVASDIARAVSLGRRGM